MTATIYRKGCGTFLGLRLHQVNDERPCTDCLAGEAHRLLVAKLDAESAPIRPTPPDYLRISPAEATANRRRLAHATRRAA